MSHVRVSLLVLAAVFCSIGTATAQGGGSPQAIPSQEPPTAIGITMGYPASIGAMWHVTDRVAVRPELSFSVGTTESSAGSFSSTSSDSWSLGAGVSALFYLRQRERLRTYVAPRFSYGRSESTVDSSSFGGTSSELSTSSVTLAGLFGASYALHARFAVFGEVGVGLSDSESTSTVVTGARTDGTRFGTQSGVGVIFYLR
jgi:hypothetical protein